jgi:hypothetical protein
MAVGAGGRAHCAVTRPNRTRERSRKRLCW